jgi:hypothetical protein
MKKLIPFLFLALYCTIVKAQTLDSIAGKYIIHGAENDFSIASETIWLYKDHSFLYQRVQEIGNSYTIKGSWNIKFGALILNSNDSSEMNITVDEYHKEDIKKVKAKISIHSIDHCVPPTCNIIINEGDPNSEREYKLIEGPHLINKKTARTITISTAELKYETYAIKNCNANYFNITLKSHRILKNEKWLLINGTIVPMEPYGEYANYCLKKTKNEINAQEQ